MSPKRVVPVVAVVLAVAGGLAWWALRPREAEEALASSGTVEATEAHLGFDAGGRLAAVAVREGDRVAAGAELAHLAVEEAAARREGAVAAVAVTEARLAELDAGFRREEVAEARAAAAGAADQLAEAHREAERAEVLFAGGAISQEVRDRAATAAEVAASSLAQARARLALLEEGPRAEQRAAARAQLAQARAALDEAEARLSERVLAAPFAGIVLDRHREPGEVVAPGSPVITLIDPADRWVRVFVAEDRVAAVSLGMAAEIRSDTFPDRAYRGEVTWISPEAEFTPKNVQTPEERVRLVYAVKVRVVEDPGYELKPGMPADVRLAPAPAP